MKANYDISLAIILLLLMSSVSGALLASSGSGMSYEANDSIYRADTLLVTDTLMADSLMRPDTLATDTAAEDKQAIDAPVVYEASDSIVFTRDGFARLYGKAKVNYQEIQLDAAIITMNMDSSTVFAEGIKDSTGVISGKPVFKDGSTPYESETMRYNFDTKKGYITNVTTQQGEGFVTSQDSKKGPDDELYMKNGWYTTCDNHEHPHFYLKLTRAKVKQKKNVVFGPAYMVVEDVPLPLAIPFGFSPSLTAIRRAS